MSIVTLHCMATRRAADQKQLGLLKSWWDDIQELGLPEPRKKAGKAHARWRMELAQVIANARYRNYIGGTKLDQIFVRIVK